MQQYQINSKKGRQEWLARMGAGAPVPTSDNAYGTGWDIAAKDAITYLLYQRVLQDVVPSDNSGVNYPVYRIFIRPSDCASPVRGTPNLIDYTAGVRAQVRYYLTNSAATTAQPSVAQVSPSTIVDLVRNTFALTIRDAADVFQVSRPTIYQWLKLESIDLIRSSADRDRLKRLYSIAVAWTSRPKLSGRWYQLVLPSGQTLLDILKGENLDSQEFSRFHTLLTQQSSLLQSQEHIRARSAIDGMRDSFADMERDRPNQKRGAES